MSQVYILVAGCAVLCVSQVYILVAGCAVLCVSQVYILVAGCAVLCVSQVYILVAGCAVLCVSQVYILVAGCAVLCVSQVYTIAGCAVLCVSQVYILVAGCAVLCVSQVYTIAGCVGGDDLPPPPAPPPPPPPLSLSLSLSLSPQGTVDYTPPGPSLIIASGTTEECVSVDTMEDDALEGDHSFVVSLSTAVSGVNVTSTADETTVTITDDGTYDSHVRPGCMIVEQHLHNIFTTVSVLFPD